MKEFNEYAPVPKILVHITLAIWGVIAYGLLALMLFKVISYWSLLVLIPIFILVIKIYLDLKKVLKRI